MPTTVCTRCQRALPADVFARDASKPSGHKPHCKECDNARSRQYYAKNAVRIKAKYQPSSNSKACADCGTSIPARTRSGRCADCYPEYRRRRDAQLAKQRRVASPELERARREKRRRAKGLYSDVTPQYIAALYRQTKHCPLCDTRLIAEAFKPNSREVDHIVPLNVGGTHTIGNLRVICRGCNLRRPKDGSDVTGQVTLWAADAVVFTKRVDTKQQRRRALAETKRSKAASHRSKAEEALRLRRSGEKWQDIADALGYANASGPYLLIRNALGFRPTGLDHEREPIL